MLGTVVYLWGGKPFLAGGVAGDRAAVVDPAGRLAEDLFLVDLPGRVKDAATAVVDTDRLGHPDVAVRAEQALDTLVDPQTVAFDFTCGLPDLTRRRRLADLAQELMTRKSPLLSRPSSRAQSTAFWAGPGTGAGSSTTPRTASRTTW